MKHVAGRQLGRARWAFSSSTHFHRFLRDVASSRLPCLRDVASVPYLIMVWPSGCHIFDLHVVLTDYENDFKRSTTC
jgi:hypothetical protein